MHKLSILVITVMMSASSFGQRAPERIIDQSLVTEKIKQSFSAQPLSPTTLWKLGRVSGEGLTPDGKTLIYGVSYYSPEENKSEKKLYAVSLATNNPVQLTTEKGTETVVKIEENGNIIYLHNGQLWRKNLDDGMNIQLTQVEGGLENVKFSPDGEHILFSRAVLLKNFHSVNRYEDLPKSDVYIYDDLDYRHWDKFNDGRFNHPFVASYKDGQLGEAKDILANEPFYSPQMPFGGSEDFAWSPDSRSVLYVCKKSYGKAYAHSTNTDIYQYDLATGTTSNITVGMNGYDTQPGFSADGQRLAWLSMKTVGYEADKNDIVLMDIATNRKLNLTAHWDGTVSSFLWSKDNKKIYFTAPTRGTIQLFVVDVPANLNARSLPRIQQISEGQFDISGIVGETKEGLVVTSTKITRPTEVYLYALKSRKLQPITHVNDTENALIKETQVVGRTTKASDGKDLFSWVVYPPDFDPNKKYPTLLYCQGGPQSMLTQAYSFRWNLQLIASQGYIVIAPNRRGMPGWGVAWNEEISGDWGGQPIRDYLSAIDDMATESYVDKDRLGAVGASYGGYSVFMLAGVHEGRFKTFISHCGLFDMTSWYGTTEELFFANHELGGPYWDKANEKSYTAFNPITHINKWDTPILIFQGGKDYRVPIEQGLEAFQAAQLKGIKSRLVYFPDENHRVLTGQNAQVWHREFFTWLEETL